MDIVDELLLEHHGIKGMKWGIRNDKGHEGEKAKTNKINKLDKNFAKNSTSLNTVIAINNRAADLTNKNDINRINNKPEYKNQDFRRDSPLRQKYYKEHQNAFLDNVETAANEMGTNASGTKKYGIVETNSGWNIVLLDVKHASNVEFSVKVNYDEMGYITSIEPVSSIKHDVIQDILEHHGVKGMHWGIRNKNPRRESSDFKKTKSFRGKKSHELTNKQIKQLNDRQALEKTFRKNNPSKVGKHFNAGHAFVKGLLGVATTAGIIWSLPKNPAVKHAITFGKKMVDLEIKRRKNVTFTQLTLF